MCNPRLQPRSSFNALRSTGSFLPIAPPVNSLNVVRVIISPGSAHSPRADMVWNNVTVIREIGAADAAFTALGNDLSIEQLAHLSVRAELAVTSRMKWIFYSADAELSTCLRFRNYFPSATETRTMDRANLVATKSHDVSPNCHSNVWGCLGKAKGVFHGMGESVVGRAEHRRPLDREPRLFATIRERRGALGTAAQRVECQRTMGPADRGWLRDPLTMSLNLKCHALKSQTGDIQPGRMNVN